MLLPVGGRIRDLDFVVKGPSNTPKGASDKGSAGASSGVTGLAIEAGAVGKTSVKLQARGGSLVLPGAAGASYFHQDPAVAVQLINEVGSCWTSGFDADQTKQNEADGFKASAKQGPRSPPSIRDLACEPSSTHPLLIGNRRPVASRRVHGHRRRAPGTGRGDVRMKQEQTTVDAPAADRAGPEGGDAAARPRVVAVLPAFHAAATLEKTVRDIPAGSVDEIILVDDASEDDTVAIARALGLTVLVHDRNRGYGANQKTCYAEALRRGADIVVMIHPDYQYDSRLVPVATELLRLGNVDVVVGSRIRSRAEVLGGGMPVWKYVANRALTFLENVVLGQNLGDFHSGFRAYRREVLEAIPWGANSDDFVFDTQLLAQAVLRDFRIGDIPVPVRYFPEASSIGLRSSLRYGLATLWVMAQSVAWRAGLARPAIFRNASSQAPAGDAQGRTVAPHAGKTSDPVTEATPRTGFRATNTGLAAPTSSTRPTPRGMRPAIALALAVAVGALYAPVRHHGFLHLDDNEYVTGNAAVRAGLERQSVAWAWTAFHSGHWHPLTWMSLMADVERAGVEAGPMHATSVALHAAGVAVLFLALSSATGSVWIGALAAALFAAHPLRVESVAWVAARKDVLSGLFVMLTLAAWTAFARRGGAVRYTLALAAFAAALLSKPTVAVVPCGLLLLDWWPLRRLPFSPRVDAAARMGEASRAGDAQQAESGTNDARRVTTAAWALAEKLPFFALAAATLTRTWAAQNAAGAVTATDALPLAARAANAAWNYGLYAARTVWPFDLGVFYPLRPVPVDKAVAVAALVAAATAWAWRWRESRPWRLLGWLWFCGMLVPVSGIVQFGGQSMADRYAYLPHIGLMLAVACEAAFQWNRGAGAAAAAGATAPAAHAGIPSPAAASPAAGAGAAAPRRAAVAATLALVLAGATILTSRQVSRWSDSITLLSHTLEVTGPNFFASNNLGVALEAAGRLDEAAVHYEEAAKLNPGWPEALSNHGIALARAGRLEEALVLFEKAVAIRPGFSRAHNNLATALSSLGRRAEARVHFAKAVELDPDYLEARVALALTLEQFGDIESARTHWAAAAAQAPDDAGIAASLSRVRAAAGSGAGDGGGAGLHHIEGASRSPLRSSEASTAGRR